MDNPTLNECTSCPKYASETGCVTTCTGFLMSGKGCYDMCPHGSVENTNASTCEIATAINCPAPKFLAFYSLIDANLYYNSCFIEKPVGMYQMMDNAGSLLWIFSHLCNNGTAFYNMTCRLSGTSSLCDNFGLITTEVPLYNNRYLEASYFQYSPGGSLLNK